MLQIDLRPYASDALEDAMRLAQTKALNSFSFSDCLNYLNYAWSDIYNRIACIDAGYYSKIVQITSEHTKLPACVQNTLKIFRAQTADSHSRQVFKASGYNDYGAVGTYHISGNDLFIPGAGSCNIYLEYVPACPLITFTRNNRDPVLYDEYTRSVGNGLYNMFILHIYDADSNDITWSDDIDFTQVKSAKLEHRIEHTFTPITITRDGYTIKYIKCDYPYIFITYEQDVIGDHITGFFDGNMEFNVWNGFDFTGRCTDVELLDAQYNDKTGLGIVIKDYNDNGKIKELGWLPDTQLSYPSPVMYRYLVARLADKFSALNESNIMGVQNELNEARYAFEAFLKKDKSAFQRIENVTGPTIGDYIL